MRLLGKILAGLVVLCVLALTTVQVLSTSKLNKQFEITDPSPGVKHDSATQARGKHLARAITKCVDCHGDDFGGKVVIDAMPFAQVVAPNLTKGTGGFGATRADDDFIRAIRHGIAPNRTSLVLMPAANYWHLTDDDVGAIVAYIRSVPNVDKTLPKTKFGFAGRLALLQGKLDGMMEARLIEHGGARGESPAVDTTVAYGKYLSEIGGCTGCHGAGLSGGPIPGMPEGSKPAANITPTGIGSWTEADFFKALREGVRPNGTPIDTLMPWRLAKEMTDVETKALYLFLKTVPAKEAGGR